MNSLEFIRKANAAALRGALKTPPNHGDGYYGVSPTVAMLQTLGRVEQAYLQSQGQLKRMFSDYTADRLLHDMRVAKPSDKE